MIKIKTLLAATALMAVPGFAIADCSWGKAEQVTMSCAPGSSWDTTASACKADVVG